MSGYFAQPEQTRQALSQDGWLDTGDIGYLVDGSIVITGRHKDMIIINGRNIWPQDIEHIAERQPELRSMDASAFFVLGAEDEEVAGGGRAVEHQRSGGRPQAHAAALPRDPGRARHLLPDRARAAAHAAAHLFRQAVTRRGPRGLPRAASAGAQGRAQRGRT
jgi:acyl-CoA synthetase (AMP-forming)/AMP-acid ligase II